MATLNPTRAFRPGPDLDAAMTAHMEREGWTMYALLTRACELLVWPDREPTPVALRAPVKAKAEKAPKKPRVAAKIAAGLKDALDHTNGIDNGTVVHTPSPKQSAFRQALANVSDGPVRPAPGSRLKTVKGRK